MGLKQLQAHFYFISKNLKLLFRVIPKNFCFIGQSNDFKVIARASARSNLTKYLDCFIRKLIRNDEIEKDRNDKKIKF